MRRPPLVPDGMSAEAVRRMIAAHEAALAALADELPEDAELGANQPPAMTDAEIDEACTKAVKP